VGPNGSGKSNVIDSMLFVFGYRAAKVRLKKLSGLIHNSEHHLNIGSCTVTVFFQKIIDTGVRLSLNMYCYCDNIIKVFKGIFLTQCQMYTSCGYYGNRNI